MAKPVTRSDSTLTVCGHSLPRSARVYARIVQMVFAKELKCRDIVYTEVETIDVSMIDSMMPTKEHMTTTPCRHALMWESLS